MSEFGNVLNLKFWNWYKEIDRFYLSHLDVKIILMLVAFPIWFQPASN